MLNSKDLKELKQEIVNSITPLNPEKIILFGSYAYGNPTNNSDIDLYIVTNDDFIPKDFEEESKLFLKYSQALRSLQGKIPIDIITHTKQMYNKFISMKSGFSKEIISKGEVLWVKS